MLHNFWRKLHLILALVAGVFLLIASVTGAILSFEPIEHIQHPYHVEKADEITLVDFLTTLDSTYSNVDFVEATLDENSFLQLSIIDEEGEMDAFYIDPRTGKKLGTVAEPNPLFDFNRKLHRSIFMGSTGRIIMGIVAAVLLLMVSTGIALVLKRQLKALKFYGKVTRDTSLSYLHIQLGRWTFPLLIVISITGTYLSLDRFGFLPKENKVQHTVDFEMLADSPEIHKYEFPVFKNTRLSEVQKIQFPFTPFPEDYFQLQLKDKDLIINQYTGGIESTQHLGAIKGWNTWIFNLHTGKGSITWSLILLFAAISIVFFIVSGCSITVKRWRSKSRNSIAKNEARIVLLLGSESGQTAAFAKHFKALLQKNGQSVYIDVLNNFGTYARMEQLFVLTSTYGKGEPPSNARHFLRQWETHAPTREFEFSVLGFGSTDYPDYCQFAEEVHQTISKVPVAKAMHPLTKVNKQSAVAKQQWLRAMAAHFNITLKATDLQQERETIAFKVQEILPPSEVTHQHFRLTLESEHAHFQSGDLLAILPKGEDEERLYSIGKINNSIALSIRKHNKGICSTYLASLSKGNTLSGRIQANNNFHFPEDVSGVFMIANGTGIAPLLGMIAENHKHVPIQLLWGIKSETVSELYTEALGRFQNKKHIDTYHLVYSQSKKMPKQYVQDVLEEHKNTLVQLLSQNGAIMICGSIAMQEEVMRKLAAICIQDGAITFETCLSNGQVVSDCY